VGVSTNILEASWQALADGIRYYLLRRSEQPALEPTEVPLAAQRM
jgi:2-isopropylmalate synthase